MSDNDVVVRFGGSIENLITAVNSARGSIESLAEPFTTLQAAIGGMGEALAAAFAIEGIKSFAESMAELGTQTSRAAQILGISTEEVGGLDLIAKATGSSLQELQVAFGRLSKSVIDESDPAKRALAALGLSFSDIRNLTPIAQLELLATKFSGIKDGADKDAIAIALLGRAGESLIPLFNEGPEGISRWADASERLGTALSSETVKEMERMHAALLEVNTAIKGASIQIFNVFSGAIIGAAKGISDLASEFTNAVQKGGALQITLDLLGILFSGLVSGIATVTAFFEAMWSTATYAVSTFAGAFGYLGHALKDIVSLDFSKVNSDFNSFASGFNARTSQFNEEIAGNAGRLQAELATIWGTGDKKIETEHAQSQARMAAPAGTPNTGAFEAARKEIEGEIKLLQQGLTLKKTVWDGEVAAHKLSKEQEYASLMQATEKEYQAELALLEKEKGLPGQKPQQIQEINNKIEALQAQHQIKMVKLDQDALAEETASWQRYFDIVTTSFNSQLRGLITGTTTFKNAFKNMLLDIGIKFIETIENMGTKWAAEQLGMTTVAVTGAQARAAAETASSTAASATNYVAILHSISASAGETFAGIFGFLSPVLGPAAAGPATEGMATVLSVGGGLASFATGAWNLPSNIIAQLHQGEMVVPAGVTPWAQGALSAAAKNGQPGGRGDVHHTTNININAVDASGFGQLLKNNDGALLKAIERATRHGVHLGLSRFR